ncbi:hypothetical protein midi_00514 [Candidatus Midichloria mitochondrii IricVA]|uniref:Uncharacterized protein n=2 Tax=Candidatus Midichloria mitochondrii TaxID=234827 RepID=F7XVX1_MIDMI|nr:hypothetical protein midi_00514 [Candidatus Midichloria mitochondrii IricVA]
MQGAVISLIILLNCCKGKQTGTLDSTKAGRFVITYVLAVIRSLKASPAKQFLGQNLFFSGLLAYVFKPNISHGKIGPRAYSLRRTEVMTNMGEYLNSLNAGEIKSTGWGKTSYDI